VFGLVQLQGAGDGVEDAVGYSRQVASLQLRVVIGAHSGEHGDFLATQLTEADLTFVYEVHRAIPIAHEPALHDAGAAVWATVTTPGEAVEAAAAGVDALIAQGVEAGGHRGSFDDGRPGDLGLLALLQLVAAAVELPLVATGGLATGRSIAAVLAAGARAAQLGTVFMRTPEAATSPAQRAALQEDAPTALTRAFTGRTARGIVNRFLAEHAGEAPAAYPDVHHLTAPLRAAARARGDAGALNLWAGQAYPLATEEPAGDLVRRLAAEARDAVREAAARVAP